MLDTVPAKPVKFMLRFEPADKARAYVPVVKLKLIELASSVVPELTVVAVAVALETLTTCVPVAVKPVTMAVVQMVPVPLTVIFPVPKAIVRVAVPLPINRPAVSV